MSISAQDVSVRLAGRLVLRQAGLEAPTGALIGLVGPNGAGKTTLLRTLAGLQPIEGGSIEIGGRPLEAFDRRALARAVAYLPQGARVHWPLTAERVVALGRMPHLHAWSRYDAADRQAVSAALDAVDAGDFAARSVTALSTGERARVLLARVLAGEPAVLLADEPVAALDPSHQLLVLDLLRARCSAGLTAVVVLHDLTLAARYCDRLTLLTEGRTLIEGTPETVLTPDVLRDAYGIDADLRFADGIPQLVARGRVTVERRVEP